jgi:hypothetical protein
MQFLHSTFSSMMDMSIDKIFANKKYLAMGLAGVASIALVGSGVVWYRHSTQEAAQKAFSDALKYYNAGVGKRTKALETPERIEFTSEEEKWARVVQHYEQAYQRHKNAGIGPMFKVYQADALVSLGQQDEAIKAVEDVVGAIASGEVREFVKLKLALMKLDSKKQAVQAEGLKSLTALAEDVNGYCHEAGLYYLGYYYFTNHDAALAKNYWQQLMVKYGMKDSQHQSGLAEQARGKLKMISADW